MYEVRAQRGNEWLPTEPEAFFIARLDAPSQVYRDGKLIATFHADGSVSYPQEGR